VDVRPWCWRDILVKTAFKFPKFVWHSVVIKAARTIHGESFVFELFLLPTLNYNRTHRCGKLIWILSYRIGSKAPRKEPSSLKHSLFGRVNPNENIEIRISSLFRGSIGQETVSDKGKWDQPDRRKAIECLPGAATYRKTCVLDSRWIAVKFSREFSTHVSKR
jgi:hypothetical protein